MGNALLNMKDTLCGDRMKKVFDSVDTDGSGSISKQELADWIADERLAGNKYFLPDTLEEQTERMMKRLDVDGDKKVSKMELFTYLDQLQSQDLDQLVAEVERSAKYKRRKVLKQVFEALDVNETGSVSKDEVLFWLQNERSWRKFGADAFGERGGQLSKRGREKVFKQLDRDRDGRVTLRDLESFFEDWSIKEIRDFSEDQMYYKQLEEYKRNPTEERKAKLTRMKSDLEYSDKTKRDLMKGADKD